MPKSKKPTIDDMGKEAMRPVRKSESGRYKDLPLENLKAAGNDEDGESLKKKKK